MTITNYGEIDLASICPNPKNPRRHYDARKLDELTASVKSKGVIEPIIVRRTLKGKAQYEIVAGERRFRAAAAAGLATIPAIVRELTDDEAYDFMLIENLQRDDLTNREEAESFKGYIGRHGEDAIAALAEKTGISPAYIRARIRILELPARVLKAWDEGKLCFGHLHQLLRISGDPQAFKDIASRLMRSSDYGDTELTTVHQLRRWINDLAPALSGAFFPMKEACAGCASNSLVQKDLFDVDAGKAQCLNPACFKKHQNDYLAGHWKETGLAKAHGTNGFRFEDRRGQLNYHNFRYGPRPAEKCKECPSFVTIIELGGKVDEAQVCVGRDDCFHAATRAAAAKATRDKSAPKKPGEPRATWHGVYFRDIFLRRRIEERLVEVPKEPGVTTLAEMLLLFALIKSENAAREAVAKDMKLSVNRKKSEPLAPIDKAVLTRPKDSRDLVRQMLVAAKALILGGQDETVSWEYGMSIGGHSRAVIAELLGIDLAKEYAVDKDYLDKKTKAEILAFGKTFKLFDKNVDAAKLKKSELVKVVLAHGPKLVGKVPAEILKVK
ncbi:MAG: ParB/RepB/Spo0J family partition protein [Acidobacteria bacterium]|nr:ParB/RepB/Spo0J family partition protein [Acidobacteriota bacterium]